MGWFSGWSSKEELVKELLSDSGVEQRSLRGNELWCIYNNGTERFILLYLLSGEGGSWGYKSMDESMGPAYYNCPQKFLKSVPCPDSDYARNWRQGVVMAIQNKKDAKTKAASLAVGDKITLPEGFKPNVFRITQLSPLTARALEGPRVGTLFALPKKHLNYSTIEKGDK